MTEPLPALAGLSPDRVCIIKPSSLGDIVHALPALAALRARWPSAHLTWVVNRGLRGLLDGHPDLDEVLPFDRAGAGPMTWLRLMADLRRRRFDLTVDLQGLFRSGVMALATGARYRVGSATAREGAPRFYTHPVPGPRISEAHAVDRMLAIVAGLGADASNPRFVLATAAADRERAREALADVPSPRLVLNIGARWATKRWPAAHFAEVARRAATEVGAGLVVVGAPEDRPLVDALREGLGPLGVLDLAGRTSLPGLAAILAAADVVLSNDTGPLHLAAAAGARVVGIYTCTSPKETGPYGPRAVAVESKIWCAASYVTRCDRLDCMAELTPDRVWRVVRAQLLEARAGRTSAA